MRTSGLTGTAVNRRIDSHDNLLPVIMRTKYYHRLYETDSLIVLAPNGEGVIKVVFCVEMRRPPWIKILFENNDFEAVLVEKSTVEIKLKVFCRTIKAYVKTSEEIKIVGVELDAEIYDDESTVPAGFM